MRCSEMVFREKVPTPSLPPGKRVYAIGDAHGEIALLANMLKRILKDIETRNSAETTLIVLGDFIDRGAGAAELLKSLSEIRNSRLIVLKGNHESLLVDVYHGNVEAMRFWLRLGGKETLRGLGATDEQLDFDDPEDLLAIVHQRLSHSTIEWLEALPTHVSVGDYYFTHAGVRPGIALDDQNENDLLWIRKPFILSKSYHGRVVVHGHTISRHRPKLGRNRIGLDTGAHEFGCLTALGLEGNQQWLLQETRVGL